MTWLASFADLNNKYPRRIEFVVELPKGPTGKILRRQLRDREFAPSVV